jgi:N-acetylglucosamine-6-phosphate deacetylase
MIKCFAADTIFYQGQRYTNSTAVFAEGVFQEIIATQKSIATPIVFKNGWLSPGFIDCQVYGASNQLLSEYPQPETLATMVNTFASTGTVLCVPTVATNSTAVTEACILAVKNYIEAGGLGIAGIHLEGPWIAKEKRGAHVAAFIQPITEQAVLHWLQLAAGTWKMVTLAPELCTPAILNLLQKHQVIVSAGHSQANFTQATTSFEQGVTAVTHLYNAMSGHHHRQPGLVEAALLHPTVFTSIIPDGVHVSFEHVRLAATCKPSSLFAITDAVTTTTTGPYQHSLAGNHYASNGTLSGSSISMLQALYNLVHHVKLPLEQAVDMCTTIPATLLQTSYATSIENWIVVDDGLQSAKKIADL